MNLDRQVCWAGAVDHRAITEIIGNYIEKRTGNHYGPPYGTGDEVGCCISLYSRVIFFTKNGKHLGKQSNH